MLAWAKRAYQRYEMVFVLYMLEPWEKVILNTLLIGGTVLTLYKGYDYSKQLLAYMGAM